VKFYRFCRTMPQFFSNLFISQQTSVNTARGGCNESHRFYASFRVIPLPDSIHSSVINFKWISPQIRHVPLCDQPSRPTLPSAFSTPDTAKLTRLTRGTLYPNLESKVLDTQPPPPRCLLIDSSFASTKTRSKRSTQEPFTLNS
jgi:hypothetical protein